MRGRNPSEGLVLAGLLFAAGCLEGGGGESPPQERARCALATDCPTGRTCLVETGECVVPGGSGGAGGGAGGTLQRATCAELDEVAPRIPPYTGGAFGALRGLEGLGASQGLTFTPSLIREGGELFLFASSNSPLSDDSRTRPYRWRLDGAACAAGSSREALAFVPDWTTRYGGLGRMRPLDDGFVAPSSADETGSIWWDPWPAIVTRVGYDGYAPPAEIGALWDRRYCTTDGGADCDGIYGLDPFEDDEGLRMIVSRASPSRVLWEVPCSRDGGLVCDPASGQPLTLPGEPVPGDTIDEPGGGGTTHVVLALQYKDPRLACGGRSLFFVRRVVTDGGGGNAELVWDEVRRSPVRATRPTLLLDASEAVTAGGRAIAGGAIWSVDLSEDCGVIVVSNAGTIETAVAR